MAGDFVRCLHDGITLKRLPADVDPRGSSDQDLHLAFKRVRSRKWLAETRAQQRAIPRNVIRFGALAK